MKSSKAPREAPGFAIARRTLLCGALRAAVPLSRTPVALRSCSGPRTHRAARLALARAAPGKAPVTSPATRAPVGPCIAPGFSRPPTPWPSRPAHHPSSEGGDGPGQTQEEAIQRKPLVSCEKREDPGRTPQESCGALCRSFVLALLRKAPPTPSRRNGGGLFLLAAKEETVQGRFDPKTPKPQNPKTPKPQNPKNKCRLVLDRLLNNSGNYHLSN